MELKRTLEGSDPGGAHRQAVFLDRDGVLNRTHVRNGQTHPPHHLGEFELLPGVPEALERLAISGYVLIVVTNQPDVARGLQTRVRVDEMNNYVKAVLPVLDVLTCFHDDADDCPCRKPRPGLILEAVRRWPIDLERSYLVGDRWSDIVAGQSSGCRTLLVETPFSRRERCVPDHVVADLPEAADWILNQACVPASGATAAPAVPSRTRPGAPRLSA